MILVIITGKVGSGKTLLLTFISFFLSKFYSNYKIKSKGYNAFKITDFLKHKYKHCGILLDEAYIYLESRTSGAKLNRNMSYLLYQSRKIDILTVLTTQTLRTIDVRYKEEMLDIVVFCKKTTKGFKYEFLEVSTGKRKKKTVKFENAMKLFKYYDSFALVNDSDSDRLLSGEEIVKHATEIASELIEKGIPTDTNNVAQYLMKNEIQPFLWKPVQRAVRILING